MSQPVKYLLDTNVLSETRKKPAHPKVTEFLTNANSSSLYVSVLTLGELRKGVALKARSDSAAAQALGAWVDGMEGSFADRIIGIDAATATLWGNLSSHRPRPIIDTLLAATAMVHQMTFVTRNTDDVADTGVKLLNPFQ